MKNVIGPTIRTQSGIYFNFVNPTLDMIKLEDIIHALSNICRFGGHCPFFYSVAEHLVRCHDFASIYQFSLEERIAILCHDFAEAYVGDMTKPLKNLLPEFSQIEERVNLLIEQKFNVNLSLPAVKEVDLTLLFAERDALFPNDEVVWTGENKSHNYKIEDYVGWNPEVAKEELRALCLFYFGE
jgi:hypothetical protein